MTKAIYNHDYFAELYRINNGDPWQYEQRWYEKRKRDMTLAVLPYPKFKNGIEIGCSNGVLSAELAERCEALLCMDANSTAIQLANQRLIHDHVKVVQGIVPLDLPPQQFDLIVASEMLYYVEENILLQLVEWMNTHLSPQGCIVACHWRHAIEGFSLNGEQVHQILKQRLHYYHHTQLQDADFFLDVWTHDVNSIAVQEGLL